MRAIHLRTADRGADDAIAAWLHRHDVEVVDCADAFDACVAALTSPHEAPDLALAGVDWISPNESAVLGYLRETWPGIIIVIHGASAATAGYPSSPLTLVCRTGDALREVLASPPGALRARLTETRRFVETCDKEWRAPPPRFSIPELRPTKEPQAPDNPATKDSSDERAKPVERRVEPPMPASPPARVTSLTAEELAALLEDWEPNIGRSADV